VTTALGLATAVAIAAASIAARHADPAEVSPVIPTGSWNAVWIAAIVTALATYTLALVVRRPWSRPPALLVALAVQLIPLSAPLLLSKDVYLYWNEARVVTVHGQSPYEAVPADYPRDPALPHMSAQWRTEPAPYGPAWEALALVPAAAAGTSKRDAARGYRLLAVAGVLAAVAAVAVATRDGRRIALLGWNPLVALHFAGGGHSDGWIAALLVLAVVAAAGPVGGSAWSLAAAFKPVPVVLLPLQLAARRFRMPRSWWMGLLGAAAIVVGASAIPWGVDWIRTSLVGIHGTSPLGVVHWLSEAGLRHRYAVGLSAAVFAAVYALLFARAWRDGCARLALAAAALCMTASLVRPWYAIWPLALAAAEGETLGAAAAVGLTWYFVLGDAVSL
jgi:alpha-1,6-mannosyltransferase